MFPPLYPVIDPSLLHMAPESCAEQLIGAGVSLIQYRAKKLSGPAYFETCARLARRCREEGVRFIVNDRPDVAAMVGAGGVHVGQEDLPAEEARRICGAEQWVGVSTHNTAQFRAATLTSADYIAVGPVFPTASKDRPDPTVGTAFLREVRKLSAKPIVAIGGITLERAAEVFRAGADSVAVIRALLDAPDLAARAREFLAVAAKFQAVSRGQDDPASAKGGLHG